MKLVIRVLILSLFASTATAEEGAGAYVTIRGGYSPKGATVEFVEQTRNLDGGYTLGGSIGFSLNDYFMFDLISLDYMENQALSSDNSTLNIITELRAGLFGGDSPLKPYIALGVGASRASLDIANSQFPSLTDWGLAWEAGAGIDCPLGDTNISLGFFYRYRSSVSLADNWNPIPLDPELSVDQLKTLRSGWEVSYHAIGIELRFGGVRGL